MQENQQLQAVQAQQDILYIYDRVCKKESKTRQILQEYGPGVLETPDAQPNYRTERPFGKEFAESQRKRAEEYFREHPARQSTAARSAWSENTECTTYTDDAGNEYIYRPAGVTGGGAAVRERSLRMRMELFFAHMFESLDSRKKNDEDIARRQAIAHKKFTENRHAIVTALLMLLVTVLFIGFVYFAFFVIADVEVEGSELYTADEIVGAAGCEVGDNLYSFHAGQAEELILFHCPQLKSAQISRTVPNAVDIVLTDDTPVYYADIYGETAVLSSGLRVLGYTDAELAEADGLTKLVLPAVKSSVAGRVLIFAEERSQRYVRSVLAAAEASSLYAEDRIDKIDVSDERNVKFICDGMYILQLGSEKESDLKLRMAYKTIGSSGFDREIPANINLTEVGEASVRYDMRLVVD